MAHIGPCYNAYLMLTVRAEQFRALGDGRGAAFERLLVEHVRQRFPELEPEADTWVPVVLRRANSYGLTGKRDLLRFLDLCAVYGVDFAAQPSHRWMHAVLTDYGITDASERLRILLAKIEHRRAVAAHNAAIARPTPPMLPEWLR